MNNSEENKSTVLYFHLDSPELFEDPEPVIAFDETGNYHLANDVLRVTLPKTSDNTKEALNSVNLILQSWIFENRIKGKFFRLRFAFFKAENLIDSSDIELFREDLQYEKDDKGELIFYRLKYPEFPIARFSHEVVTAWERVYMSYLEFGEPIQSSAYFNLTMAENRFGGRKKAASTLNIEETVLRKIGELTSIKGNINTARKSLPLNSLDLTTSEKLWLLGTATEITHRIGLVTAGVVPPFLSMESFPIEKS